MIAIKIYCLQCGRGDPSAFMDRLSKPPHLDRGMIIGGYAVVPTQVCICAAGYEYGRASKLYSDEALSAVSGCKLFGSDFR